MKLLHKLRNAFILTAMTTLLGLAVFSPIASAEPLPQVYINDKYIGFDANPVMVNGHPLVPIRKIFENLGAAVTWDESTRTLTARNSTTTVTLTIGLYNATVNGKVKSLDEPVQLIDGQTFAPLLFAVEAFNCEMNWNKEKQLFKIYYNSGQPMPPAAVRAPTAQQQVPANPDSATAPLQQQPENDVSETAQARPGTHPVVSPPVVESSGPLLAVSVTAADLNIRSEPSTSANIIGLVPCGTMLAYAGEKNGWYQVKYQGQLGWVAGWYCTPPSTTSTVSRGKKTTLLPVPSDPEAFVRQMKPYAEIAHQGTGLPINFLLAQWAEECGYGTSSLAQYYNNFGGIKDPNTGGFKQYATPEEFARDVVRLYTEHSQYAKLLADARSGASLKTLFNDLSRSGYATSKNYGEKIRTQYLPTIDEALEQI